MSNMIRRIESKHLLAFWLICLGAFYLYSPSTISNGNIYMGMLIGYIHTKTQLLQLLNPNLADIIFSAYVSLRDDYRQLGPVHNGIQIFAINVTYFAAAATVLYMLIKRFVKVSQPKTVVISALTSAALMLTIGFSVIAVNSNPVTTNIQLASVGYPRLYTVKKGDTCEKIALEYNVSVESIVQMNTLAPGCLIYPDQSLYILPARQ